MTFLADADLPGLTPASSGVSLIVALLAGTLAVLAWRARAKRGNPALVWVTLAFVAFAVKNLFATYALLNHDVVGHDLIELVLACFDLVILGLLFAPLFRRKRA